MMALSPGRETCDVHGVLVRPQRGSPGARPSSRTRLAAWSLTGGITVDLITITCCVTNAVSPQQAIGLALVGILATTAGIFGMLIPDSWAAWRRGFRQGCEAARRAEASKQDSDVSANPRREQGRRSSLWPAAHDPYY